jgi:hypothetical protein
MNTNPKNSLMSFKDAMGISGILTTARFFSVFLPLYTVGAIKGDPYSFCFALVQFLGSGFFSDFLLLTGLNRYYHKNNKQGES